MSPSHPKHKPDERPPLVKRMDQVAVAALVLVALVSVAAYWLAQGGAAGRLIEIDRAEPRSVTFQLDVNEAQWPEFSVLPGIGETLAKRIVESREADGPFADLEDLQRSARHRAQDVGADSTAFAPTGPGRQRCGAVANRPCHAYSSRLQRCNIFRAGVTPRAF